MLDRIQKYLPSSLEYNAERTAFIGLAGCVSLALISIASSQILLAVALVASVCAPSFKKEYFPLMRRILLPLVIFFAWTILTALTAPNITLALTSIKKFYLFLIIPLVPLIARGQNRLWWIYKAIFTVAAFSSIVGIGQFFLNTRSPNPLHWMFTFISQWWFFLPLSIVCLWTLACFLIALQKKWALTVSGKFSLTLLFPLVPIFMRRQKRLSSIYTAVFAIALISSIVGISLRFTDIKGNDLLHRICGLVSHWMTYSGLLMLALILLIAYGLRAKWRRFFLWVPVAALISLAIALSLTRNTMLGVYIGIFVIIALALFFEKKKRFTVFFVSYILLSAVLYFSAPVSMKQRFRSGLDPEDTTTRTRIELVDTSLRMIKDNLWFGVGGPDNVYQEALKYRNHNEFPDWLYQHMHDNFLQITAEKGIPGLLIWLWLMVQFAWDSLRTYRFARSDSFPLGEESRWEATLVSSAALGSWAALMAAGLFEYNFGDSEVLTLFLFIMSAPYAYSREITETTGKSSDRTAISNA
jgi:O-antigen ligase